MGDRFEVEGVFRLLLKLRRADEGLNHHLHLRVPADVGCKRCDRQVGNIAACGSFFIPDVVPFFPAAAVPKISAGKLGSLATGFQQYCPFVDPRLEIFGDPGDLGAVIGMGLNDDVDARDFRCEAIDILAVDVPKDDTEIEFAAGLIDFPLHRIKGVAELRTGAVLADESVIGDLNRSHQQDLAPLAFDDGASREGLGPVFKGHVGAEQWKLQILGQFDQAFETECHVVLAETDRRSPKAVVCIDQELGLFIHLFLHQRIGVELVEVKQPVTAIDDEGIDPLGFERVQECEAPRQTAELDLALRSAARFDVSIVVHHGEENKGSLFGIVDRRFVRICG